MFFIPVILMIFVLLAIQFVRWMGQEYKDPDVVAREKIEKYKRRFRQD